MCLSMRTLTGQTTLRKCSIMRASIPRSLLDRGSTDRSLVHSEFLRVKVLPYVWYVDLAQL
jgi:hypothetical protein